MKIVKTFPIEFPSAFIELSTKGIPVSILSASGTLSNKILTFEMSMAALPNTNMDKEKLILDMSPSIVDDINPVEPHSIISFDITDKDSILDSMDSIFPNVKIVDLDSMSSALDYFSDHFRENLNLQDSFQMFEFKIVLI